MTKRLKAEGNSKEGSYNRIRLRPKEAAVKALGCAEEAKSKDSLEREENSY